MKKLDPIISINDYNVIAGWGGRDRKIDDRELCKLIYKQLEIGVIEWTQEFADIYELIINCLFN